MASHAAPGTVFLPVVNAEPKEQNRLVGRAGSGDFIFVGRDTGTLNWLLSDYPATELNQIIGEPFQPFGGRSVYPFALAEYLSEDQKRFKFVPCTASELTELSTLNRIVHLDNFGNAKVHITPDNLPSFGEHFRIRVDGQRILEARSCQRVMSQKEGELLAYPGSSLDGLVELAVNRGNAARQYGLEIGSKIEILERT